MVVTPSIEQHKLIKTPGIMPGAPNAKLAINPRLSRIIGQRLKRKWSPEQIAGWLKCEYPQDESYQVSHEIIYRSLFIQARGVLKKELQQYLRSKRSIRRAR